MYVDIKKLPVYYVPLSNNVPYLFYLVDIIRKIEVRWAGSQRSNSHGMEWMQRRNGERGYTDVHIIKSPPIIIIEWYSQYIQRMETLLGPEDIIAMQDHA